MAMHDLRDCFAKAGCRKIQTYIQSGNVVFEANEPTAARAAEDVLKQFGVPAVLRSAEELKVALERNPFRGAEATPERLHVLFLKDLPDAEHAASLDPNRSPGDSFAVVGREVYLHTPDGLGRSKLTHAWFDSRLRTTGTARNWRTCLKLLDMAVNSDLSE